MTDFSFHGNSQTVYFTTRYATSRSMCVPFSSWLGPMEGPLTEENVANAQSMALSIHRLTKDGKVVTLYDHYKGFPDNEYNPEYFEYMRLKAKYD